MSGKALTKTELDKMRCAVPGCDCRGVFIFHSKCHIQSPTWTMYHPEGFLTIHCATCDKAIAKIAVKPGEEVNTDGRPTVPKMRKSSQ